MPKLLELQRMILRSLVQRDDVAAAGYIIADLLSPEARLDIHRNTMIGGLTTALRLSYPAVHRIVGVEFFESVAHIFIEAQPPESAWLDAWGAGFPEFLASFKPAAILAYLPGVARLEWAVSRALHAPDAPALDLSRLSRIDPADHERIAFIPHPSLGLVCAEHPVDAVWRAVLDQDDAAMAAIDLDAGPVRLLVQRLDTGVEVVRISEPMWRFAQTLYASRPLPAALAAAPEIDAAGALAEHLAAGRFTDFKVIEQDNAAAPSEILT
ncbi:MAG: HvfC/BufC family peptide modification chaperone [Bradyrhizobium sp.]